MKYYEVHTYTPYCGEEKYHYIDVPDDYDFHRVELWADKMLDYDASDWYDDETAESYDDNYANYRSDCGWDLREITKEEYEVYA